MKSKKPLILAACAVLTPLLLCAEDVYVNRPELDVRSGKGAIYPIVGQPLHKGDKLNVIAHEGKWLKVQVGDQTGFVFEESISPQVVKPDNGGLAQALGGSEANKMSSSAAGKGFDESTEYAKANHLDPSLLKKAIAIRDSITPQQFDDFMKQHDAR